MRQFGRSAELYESARRLMPGGVSSPVRAFGSVGGGPVFLERAEGACVFDVDGNRYVDLVGSWGPAIVGHTHPMVVEAVQRAVVNGLSFGACCAAEQQLASIIVEAVTSIDMLRFVNSGTEATMSAIRVARAVTGRPKVLKFIGGYHGHVDSLLVSAGSGAATHGIPDSAGVPEGVAATTILAPYNDLERVRQVFDEFGGEIAAVLVEPIAGNMGYVEPESGFLKGLRSICNDYGAILIFDEVMTGFRIAWGGYQELCDVRPDLTCLGKVIGGGLPVAAYGGRRELMSQVSPLGPVYQAGTLSGNPVAMAAGIVTLELCQEESFYDRIGATAGALCDGLRDAARKAGVSVQVGHTGGMLGLAFAEKPVRNFGDARACDHELFAKFFHAMLQRGAWLPPSGFEAMFVSSAHDDAAIATIVDAAAESFTEIAT